MLFFFFFSKKSLHPKWPSCCRNPFTWKHFLHSISVLSPLWSFPKISPASLWLLLSPPPAIYKTCFSQTFFPKCYAYLMVTKRSCWKCSTVKVARGFYPVRPAKPISATVLVTKADVPLYVVTTSRYVCLVSDSLFPSLLQQLNGWFFQRSKKKNLVISSHRRDTFWSSCEYIGRYMKRLSLSRCK